MSQKESCDELRSHPQSGTQTPIQVPSRDTSTPTLNTNLLSKHPSSEPRSTSESAPPRRSFPEHEKTYEHDLHADLHWTINPSNPRNWAKRKKWMHTVLFCAMASTTMLGASSLTLAHESLGKDFRVSSTAAVLPTSLYLLGLVLGSFGRQGTEWVGRKTTLMICTPLYAILILAAGLVKTIYGLTLFRLLAGLAAASVLHEGWVSILDIWTVEERIFPIAGYTSTLYIGSTLGTVLSGAILWKQHWRWTQFAVLIIVSILLVLVLFTNETSKTIILRQNRRDTTRFSIFQNNFNIRGLRSIRILFSPPVVFLGTLVNACNFGVLYAIFTAFPTVLSQSHGFNAGAQGLVYLGMSVGALLAIIVAICHQKWCYKPRAFDYKEEKATEEERTLYTGKRASKYSSRTSFSASTEHISIGRSSRRSTLLQSLKRLSIPTSKTFEQSNPEWRRNMKLAYAATGYLNGIDENCGRRFKPERVNNLLDQQLDFSQLCTALEASKLKFERVQLARVLVEALADGTETPATYPASAREDIIERNRTEAVSALEAPKPDTTPKPSINEKRKTWVPPSTSPPPEWRLWLALPASALIVAALFVLGWTAHSHWIATVIAMAGLTLGSLLVFMSTVVYALECCEPSESEAIWAVNTIGMFLFGFVFSLSSIKELDIGPGLGISVYAIFSIVSGSVPIGLYIFGPALRKLRKGPEGR